MHMFSPNLRRDVYSPKYTVEIEEYDTQLFQKHSPTYKRQWVDCSLHLIPDTYHRQNKLSAYRNTFGYLWLARILHTMYETTH